MVNDRCLRLIWLLDGIHKENLNLSPIQGGPCNCSQFHSTLYLSDPLLGCLQQLLKQEDGRTLARQATRPLEVLFWSLPGPEVLIPKQSNLQSEKWKVSAISTQPCFQGPFLLFYIDRSYIYEGGGVIAHHPWTQSLLLAIHDLIFPGGCRDPEAENGVLRSW